MSNSSNTKPLKENRLVLKNISIEIKFGETVAIVGRSGCGKSTLTSMIPRFIDPVSGQILMDGIPLKEIKISDIREQIGLVSQDSVLFNDTVFENIRYGRPTATRRGYQSSRRSICRRFHSRRVV